MRRTAVQYAAPLFNDRAQTAQRLQVQVDGTLSDGAAARKTQPRSPLPREHRAEEHNGAARLPHERVGDVMARNAVVFDQHRAVAALRLTAEPAEDSQRRLRVGEQRTVVEHALAACQHRCRQKRQRAVFRSLEPHAAAEPFSSRDIQF